MIFRKPFEFKSFSEQTFLRDILAALLLFFAAVIITYKFPFIFSVIFQVTLLLLYSFQKKRDYFWLALLFVIESQPGGVFSMLDPSRTFSLIRVVPFGILYFWIPFLIISLFKYINQLNKYRFFFYGLLQILFIYFVLLILSFGINVPTSFIRMLLPWIVLLVTPLILKDIKDYARFFSIIFFFVFVNLIFQFIELMNLKNIAILLGGNIQQILYIEGNDRIARPVHGILIPLFALVGALFFSLIRVRFFNKGYLYAVVFLSVLSLLFTATRGYFLGGLFIVLGYFLLISRNKFRTALRFIIPAFAFVLLINFIPVLDKQLDQSLNRLETIQYLLEGDATAGGTLVRIDVRSPRVLNKFYESPITGYGYGQEAFNYSDLHVGNQNLLLHTGIVGYALFLSFWLYFIYKMLERENNLSPDNPYKGSLLFSVIVLTGIIIIHSTSHQIFDYLVDIQHGMMLFIFFSLSNYLYYRSAREEIFLRKLKREILFE